MGFDPQTQAQLAHLASQGWVAPPDLAAPPPPPPPPQPIPLTASSGPDSQPPGGVSRQQVAAQQAADTLANTLGYADSGGGKAAADAQQAAQSANPPEPKLIGMTKAGYVPHSQSTTEEKGIEYSPETKAAEASAMKAGVEANRANEEMARATAEEQRVRAQREAAQLAADQNEYAVRKDQQNNARQEHWAKLQESESELSHAQSQGIDPNRYMNSMSTGGRVATLISLMAGGFAAGVKGGPNEALGQLNATIDRDISAQRDALAGKEKSVAAGQSLYGILRQKGMDDDAAADGAKILAHQQLQKQLEAELTTTSDAQAKLTLQQAIEKNSAFLSELGQKFDAGAAGKVSTTTSQAYQQSAPIYSGGGGDDRKAYQQYVDHWLGGKQDVPKRSYSEWRAARGGGSNEAGTPAGAGKVNQKVARLQSAADEAGQSIADIKAMESENSELARLSPVGWASNARVEKGETMVAAARGRLAAAGLSEAEVKAVLPDDYNPAHATLSGARHLEHAEALLKRHSGELDKLASKVPLGGGGGDSGGGEQ